MVRVSPVSSAARALLPARTPPVARRNAANAARTPAWRPARAWARIALPVATATAAAAVVAATVAPVVVVPAAGGTAAEFFGDDMCVWVGGF
ncbi:MAG: hypothetical protein LBR07_06390 [Puniceicoccales bacterium]|jgi:hypothetical protein|nr:hypothetical protein [Puniceicoccales bacterium]